jgi:hypothetical protein
VTGGLLALDVATTTGWAYGAPGDRPAFGRFRSGKPRPKDNEGNIGEALRAFCLWLGARCIEWQPSMIVFEAPYVPRFAPRKVRTRTGQVISTEPTKGIPIDINVVRKLFAMCGLVEMIAYEHAIPCREEQSNVICRHFTGNGSWGGRANKKIATQRMCAVHGFPNVTEDEADALALWFYAEAVRFTKVRSAGPLFALGDRARFT